MIAGIVAFTIGMSLFVLVGIALLRLVYPVRHVSDYLPVAVTPAPQTGEYRAMVDQTVYEAAVELLAVAQEVDAELDRIERETPIQLQTMGEVLDHYGQQPHA